MKVSDEDFRRRHTPDTTTFEGSDVALRTRAKRVISGGERMSYGMILVAEFPAIRPVSDDMHAYYDRRAELTKLSGPQTGPVDASLRCGRFAFQKQ